MSKSMRSTLIAAALLAMIAPGARAQTSMSRPMSGGPEVRVVNNHHYRIRVVLVDDAGTHHSLGRVAPSKAEIFEPSADLIGGRPFQIKVFADEPVWSAGNTGQAIRSRGIAPDATGSIYVWVEPDLTRTQISVGR